MTVVSSIKNVLLIPRPCCCCCSSSSGSTGIISAVAVAASVSLLLDVVVVVVVVVVGGPDDASSSVVRIFPTVSLLGEGGLPIVALSFNTDSLDEKFSQSAVLMSPSAASKSVIVSFPGPQSKESAPPRPVNVSSPLSPKNSSSRPSEDPTSVSSPLPP